MGFLTLKHILWELTVKCNNNCDYCGSKNIINKVDDTTSFTYENILNNIIKYPPQEAVTLTGGEPTISSYFENTLVKLAENQIKVRLVTKNYDFYFNKGDKYTTSLELLDWVGLSINTKEDIEYINNNMGLKGCKILEGCKIKNKTTMITNFGSHNIFEFEELYNHFIGHSYKVWQIQLTMGKQYQLNKEGIKYLYNQIFEKTNQIPNNPIINIGNQQIQISDNMQAIHQCMGGVADCSISYDGEVMSCLSKRTWATPIPLNRDMLLENNTLKDIWENKFKDERFNNCVKCCRDYFDYPDFTRLFAGMQIKQGNGTPPLNIFMKDWSQVPQIAYYMVAPYYDKPTIPVHPYDQILAYAVIPFRGNDSTGRITTTTSIGDEDFKITLE